MKEIKIKFSSAEDARQFMRAADQCEFDIDVLYHHLAFDAKSVMAIFSMDFTNPVIVKYHGENEVLEACLSKLAV